MSEQTIEQELCAALKTEQKPKEHRQDYLQRLVKTCRHKMTDDEWNALREVPTQEWVNKNLELLSKGRDASKKDDEIDLVDFPDREQEEDVASTETTDDEKPARKKTASKKSADKPAVKKTSSKSDDKKKAKENDHNESKNKSEKIAKPAKEKRGNSGGSSTGSHLMIRESIVDNPKITADELAIMLERKGLAPSKLAICTTRSNTLITMRIILAQPIDKIKELKKALGV